MFINVASIITVISYEQLFTIINHYHYQPFLTKDTFGIASMHRFGLLQGTNALQKADGFMVSPWENIGISNCPAISTGGYFAKGNRSPSKKWDAQRIPKPHGSSEPTLRPRGVAYPELPPLKHQPATILHPHSKPPYSKPQYWKSHRKSHWKSHAAIDYI